MKKIILLVAFFATVLTQVTFAQDSTCTSVQQVITSYLNVKNALTRDKPDSVRAYANILSNNVLNVTMKNLSANQHTAWMKYSEALSADASTIGKSTDLKKQRKTFANLSSTFYKMLKDLNVNTTDVFYQYCPMADAYWISENPKIQNPYYGKQMPSCGSTKETLKAIQE